MAHVQTAKLKLWKPQDINLDKISSQKMFVDNINAMEAFGTMMLSRIHGSVASISALKAINTSDTTIFKTGILIMVIGSGIYYFDRNSTATASDTVVVPTIGGGKWIAATATHLEGIVNDLVNALKNYNIKTYTSLEQLGLSDNDMSNTNAFNNFVQIFNAMPNSSQLWLTVWASTTETYAANMQKSIMAKLATDTGNTLNSAYFIRIEKSNAISMNIDVIAQYNTGSSVQLSAERYSCVLRYSAGTVEYLSPFTLTRSAHGFLSGAGGIIKGDLNINKTGSPASLRMTDVDDGYGAVMQLANNRLTTYAQNVAGDMTNYRALLLSNSAAQSNIVNGLMLADTVNGKLTTYNVIHTGNLSLISGIAPATVEE